MARLLPTFAVLISLCGCGERADLCAQVTDLEVCWGKRSVHARARSLPHEVPASRPWACEGEVCKQRWPRLPDDGHWECVDLDGAVICRGGEPPAGAVAGPPAGGWICGDGKPRVCVDFAPEMPEGATRGWRCMFEHAPDERRICRRDASAPGLGRACSAGACPNGTTCADGRCLPARPAPACWLDRECGGGRCVLGSCTPAHEVKISSSPRAVEPAAPPAATLAIAPIDQPQLGFDAPFTIEVGRAHPDAAQAEISWRLVFGPDLQLAYEDRGFRVRGRTPRYAHEGPLAPGLVSFSPRTSGEGLLEGTLRCAGHPDEKLWVRVGAAARSSPVPSVALGHDVYLAGPGWQLRSSPTGTATRLEPAGELVRLRPDRRGRFVLDNGAGGSISLRVGRYDETPLDCGRAECHPNAAAAATTSKMTTVLYRGVEGQLGEPTPRCAIACHAVGEPGLADGGYADVAHGLSTQWSSATPWRSWPSPLRTLGGVGCTTCHGPGAIPEPGARTAILSSEVCASCHDAPPRYGHVAAWRSSRIARAPTVAQQAKPCARCHDTAGFLDAIGVRAFVANTPTEGVGCPACHAPHDPKSGTHLLRTVELKGAYTDAPIEARLCLKCHAPEEGGPTLPPGGAHATIQKGCIGCHSGGPAVERGAGHAFKVDRKGCTQGCHADGVLTEKAGRSIRDRALALWKKSSAAPHADATEARELRLLIDDPAAVFHDAARARQILDAAEAAH